MILVLKNYFLLPNLGTIVKSWSKFGNIFPKFRNDHCGQIPREHSKVHVLKKNRTLYTTNKFFEKSLYYIKTKDIFYQLIELFF